MAVTIRGIEIPKGEALLALEDEDGEVVLSLVDEKGRPFRAIDGDVLETVKAWKPGDDAIVVRRVVN